MYGSQENPALSVCGVPDFHNSQLPARAAWMCGCVILTLCDFKMLRLQELKKRTFCESRILGFDDLMIQ